MKEQKKLDMICLCDKEGNVSPIKFQFDENDEQITLKVLSFNEIDTLYALANPVRVFDAVVASKTRQYNVKLMFTERGSTWTMEYKGT